MHHYIYDANGERVLKSSSNFIQVEENGTVLDQDISFDNYTTYASPEIVIDAENNYTKHYFEGSTRIVTRLGGDASIFEIGSVQSSKPAAPDSPGKSNKFDATKLQNKQKSDLNHYFKLAGLKTNPGFKAFNDGLKQSQEDKQELRKILKDEAFVTPKNNNQASGIFYYHADHLGSNEIISDDTGKPYEFHLTLPFGETMVEQRKPDSDYYNSWKFTGKELDEEKGLYYYGARFYEPSWSFWMSVDPLVEKYQAWSPYNYTMDNPVKFVDPDGMSVVDPGDLFTSQRAAAIDFSRFYNGRSIMQYREYGSTIYKLEKDGKTYYSYSIAKKGSNASVIPSQNPKDTEKTAYAHTHGGYEKDYDNNNFSGDGTIEGGGDKAYSQYYKIDGYVSTPNGSIKEYNVDTDEEAIISTSDAPSDPKDPTRKNKISPKEDPMIKESIKKINEAGGVLQKKIFPSQNKRYNTMNNQY